MSRGMRTRSGDVQTAVRTYVDQNDHRIVVVGTVHLGEQRYFEQLLGYISREFDSGSAIQYELIRKATDAEVAKASDRCRNALVRFRETSKAVKLIADIMSLPTQHVWFPMPSAWRNVDVNDLELIQAHDQPGGFAFLDTMESFSKLFSEADNDQRRVADLTFRFMFRHINFIVSAGPVLKKLGLARGGMNDKFILDYRNQLAVNAATSEQRPVVTVWGAGHLSGIHGLLTARGYQMIIEDWVTAISRSGRHRK